MLRVEFRILGPLEVCEGDSPLTPSGAALRALLAILLLHANEVVSIDRLLDALWADGPPASGAAALHVRVSQLRRALGPAGPHVVTRPPGYAIEVGRGELDVYRFEELVDEADDADPVRAAALLRQALGLWRGPPLGDVEYESFAQPAIARLGELRLAAIERRVEADLALGRHAELIGELTALVAASPLRERLRGQLMLALYRSGRHAEALAVYSSARTALVDELGIEPGPVLRHLEGAILRQDPALDLAGTEAPERALLVVALDDGDLEPLLALAEPLASKPARELILVRLVSPGADLDRPSALLRSVQQRLLERAAIARTACFTTASPAQDMIRLASEQDVVLLLLAGDEASLEDPVTRAVLASAPCDVGVLVGREEGRPGRPVLVPFVGADHDWAAIETGAWLARALGTPLWLVGPRESGRDASRLLASASLATQRAFDITAEPHLVEPGAAGIVRVASDAGFVIAGLSDRWAHEGLGEVRRALASESHSAVLLVRSGLRPGGLAPGASMTRFTWSLRS